MFGFFPQASKKTAAKRKNTQRASSNVFSMFEQSQIQEFKEVMHIYRDNYQLYKYVYSILYSFYTVPYKSYIIRSSWVRLQAFGCIDQDRDGVIKKSDLKETYAQLGMIT